MSAQRMWEIIDELRKLGTEEDTIHLLMTGRMHVRELPGGGEIMQIEKARASIVEKSFDMEKRSVLVMASDAELDRYGDSVSPDGWKLDNYNNHNPIVLRNHAYSIENIAGQAVRTWVENGKLWQVQQFDPPEQNLAAASVMYKIAAGSLRTTSVGFISLKYKKILDPEGNWTGGYTFLEQELLENSWVAVPAHPHAGIQSNVQGSPSTAVMQAPKEALERLEHLHSLIAEQLRRGLKA